MDIGETRRDVRWRGVKRDIIGLVVSLLDEFRFEGEDRNLSGREAQARLQSFFFLLFFKFQLVRYLHTLGIIMIQHNLRHMKTMLLCSALNATFKALTPKLKWPIQPSEKMT